VSGAYDSKGGYGTSASVTLPSTRARGHLLVRAGGGFRDSRGVPLADGVLEPIPTDDGVRLNTDQRSLDGFAAVRYSSNAGPWASLSASATRTERGIAAELGVESPRFWRYPEVARTIAVFSTGTGFHNTGVGRGDLELSLGYDVGRTEILSYTDRTYAELDQFENGDDRTLTLRMLGDHTLGERGDLRASFTMAEVRHDEELPATDLRYRQRLMSLGAETVWRLADQAGPFRALRLTVGGAYDAAQTPETGDKPAAPDVDDWGARAGMSTLVGDAVQLHASVSRRGRFPALREAYSGALNRFAPNPDLTAEHLTAFEAGATTSFSGGQLQLVGFHHDLDDAIVRITLPDRRFMRVNENRLRTSGVELLAAYALGRVDLSGDVAFQSSQFITPTQTLEHMENQPEVFGSVRGRMPFVFGSQISANAEYTGRQYCLVSTGDEVTLAAGMRIGGDVSRQWTLPRARAGSLLSRLETRIGVDNVADHALYDQCGLPRPGRLVRFQIRLF
jgi:outer membrane receptor protein involved in Fe transport